MATHSSVFAWRIPWSEEPCGLQSCGHKESDTTERPNIARHSINGFHWSWDIMQTRVKNAFMYSSLVLLQVRSFGQEDPFGEGSGFPLQYSCLENSMDRGAWQATVHGGHKESDMTEQLTLIYLLLLPYQKTKIMASGPITSWEIDGETVETVSDFIFWGPKITADGDCSHEIKRCLLLGRKVMTNLDSIFKSRDITLPTKVHLVKAMVFPVVIYGCESWTIKKAEHERIDAFELWCRRRLLRVPWTARTSNQSILKEISPGCSLEGLMLRPKLQSFGPLM